MIYILPVSFALGIMMQKIFHLHYPYIGLVLLISVASLLLNKEQNKTHKIILCVLFLSLGMIRLNFVSQTPDQNLIKHIGNEISFEGVITDEPDIRDKSARYTITVGQNSLSGLPQNCLASATGASTRNFSAEKYPCNFEGAPNKSFEFLEFDSKILIVAERFPKLEYGDKILVSGKLERPKNFTNDSGVNFDYVSYLAKDNIHFLMYLPKIEKVKGGEGNNFLNSLYKIKNEFIENISHVVPEPNSSLLAGITVGAKQGMGEEILDDFKKSGLIHIVVLSGYNITVIISSILLLSQKIKRRRVSFLVAGVGSIIFSLMVGFGATVMRASIMALIALFAKHYGRPNDALRALFFTAFLMIIWNPMTLFSDPSFQLSFMATLGLILFSAPIFGFISKSKFAKFIPEKYQFREIVSSTLAVQIFLLPLLIRMSGFVSLVSFVANILVLPFVPLTMYLGIFTGLFGFLPFVGKFMSFIPGTFAYIFTSLIIWVTEFSAHVPLTTIDISLPFWFLIFWYLGAGILYFKKLQN